MQINVTNKQLFLQATVKSFSLKFLKCFFYPEFHTPESYLDFIYFLWTFWKLPIWSACWPYGLLVSIVCRKHMPRLIVYFPQKKKKRRISKDLFAWNDGNRSSHPRWRRNEKKWVEQNVEWKDRGRSSAHTTNIYLILGTKAFVGNDSSKVAAKRFEGPSAIDLPLCSTCFWVDAQPRLSSKHGKQRVLFHYGFIGRSMFSQDLPGLSKCGPDYFNEPQRVLWPALTHVHVGNGGWALLTGFFEPVVPAYSFCSPQVVVDSQTGPPIMRSQILCDAVLMRHLFRGHQLGLKQLFFKFFFFYYHCFLMADRVQPL